MVVTGLGRDGSVSKVVAMQAEGPEFNSYHPLENKVHGNVGMAGTPALGRQR